MASAGSAGRSGSRPRPAHHDPRGGFRNPWPTAVFPRAGSLIRWWAQRLRTGVPADPPPEAFPAAASKPARPRGGAGELRATWIGHSTYLIQLGPFNVLTDPHFSPRASPAQWFGPRRLVPPPLELEDLPPIDAVLLSHDHYDHLDEGSVRAIRSRFGDTVEWCTPVGYADWFERRGIARVRELDWWEEAALEKRGASLRVACMPAQHWTARKPWARSSRLWCSWFAEASGRRVYFGGDSGWFPGYGELGARIAPLDLVLLPIGAYEPRWFMKSAHMNPEEAVRAYQELGGSGVLGGMHWGTFRLTDEDPLEPPALTRRAWRAAGLPPERLWLPRHGETRVVPANREGASTGTG